MTNRLASGGFAEMTSVARAVAVLLSATMHQVYHVQVERAQMRFAPTDIYSQQRIRRRHFLQLVVGE